MSENINSNQVRNAWNNYREQMDDLNVWVLKDGDDPTAEFDRFINGVKREVLEDLIVNLKDHEYYEDADGIRTAIGVIQQILLFDLSEERR